MLRVSSQQTGLRRLHGLSLRSVDIEVYGGTVTITDQEYLEFDQLLKLNCATLGSTVADRYVCVVRLMDTPIAEIRSAAQQMGQLALRASAERGTPDSDSQIKLNNALAALAKTASAAAAIAMRSLQNTVLVQSVLRDNAAGWQKIFNDAAALYAGDVSDETEALLGEFGKTIQTKHAPVAAWALILARREAALANRMVGLSDQAAINTAEGAATARNLLQSTLDSWKAEINSAERKGFVEKVTEGLEGAATGLLRVGAWVALGVLAWFVIPPLARKIGAKIDSKS